MVPHVEADSPEHAWKLVRDYLYCYAWYNAKLVTEIEPELNEDNDK